MDITMHSRRVPSKTIVLLAVLLPVACGAVSASHRTESFIIDHRAQTKGAPAKIFLPDGLTAKRSRPVTLNPRLKTEGALAVGDSLVLDLFDDASYQAVIDRITKNIHGTITVRARIEAYAHGYVLVSTTDGHSLGTIKIPERHEHFAVISAQDGREHYLLDIVGRIEAPCCSPLIPPPPTPDEAAAIEDLQLRLAEKSLGPADWASIDVMIVYTPAALDWVADHGGSIENVMAQAMETAQLTLDNSQTYLRFNLVFSSLVDYAESGSYNTDLQRLTYTAASTEDPDGYMDEVHDWRDQHHADLVVLLAVVDIGGVAWLLDSARGRPDRGFSLTNITRVSFDYIFIHEIGHNMGCGHHKEQNVQPGPGLGTDSAGWRWAGNDGIRYCSVMTYPSGRYFSDGVDHTQVAHFSNPYVSYAGRPTGNTMDGYNTRIVRLVKHTVAAYRGERPPTVTRLASIFPNPFNASTTIAFDLAYNSHVDLRIFDLRGRLVRVVQSGHMEVGRHRLAWNGTDLNGHIAPSGAYLCRMKASEYEQTMKLLLVK